MQGGIGRPAIAPEILFALWRFATLEGIGSAREIARLIDLHDAYRWIGGGVPVNHHTLSDFRSRNRDFLDERRSANWPSLMAVAQDGVRVRAGAGAGSFRREEKLQGYLEAAKQRVATLKQQVDDASGVDNRPRQAAAARVAQAREARIQAALDRLPERATIKQRQGQQADGARASTTEADASVMKMGDGGFCPADHLQYGTEVASQIRVGVEGVTTGSDQGQLAPRVEQVSGRCGQAPAQGLVDGGYPGHDPIEAVADQTEVIAPVPKAQAARERPEPAADPHAPKPGDSPAVIAWRARMATEAAKQRYQERAATAECVNAQARNRGRQRLPVRGLAQVKGVALRFALAHNLERRVHRVPAWFGRGTATPVIQNMAG